VVLLQFFGPGWVTQPEESRIDRSTPRTQTCSYYFFLRVKVFSSFLADVSFFPFAMFHPST
jgi:hypothetical protein